MRDRPGDACSTAGSFSGGGSRAAADVDNMVTIATLRPDQRRSGNAITTHEHRPHRPVRPRSREVGVMVDRAGTMTCSSDPSVYKAGCSSSPALPVRVELEVKCRSDLIPIEAADRLGLRPVSATVLRRTRVGVPGQRLSGRRMGGSEELRRLAFVKVDPPTWPAAGHRGRCARRSRPALASTVRQQIAELDQVIAQAQAAQ